MSESQQKEIVRLKVALRGAHIIANQAGVMIKELEAEVARLKRELAYWQQRRAGE